MPWKDCLMTDERMKFVKEIQKDEESFAEICRAYGVSRPTGYKWWKRFSEFPHEEALKDRPRTPLRMVRKTRYDIEVLICECRRKHKNWGPEKILARLKKDHPRRKWPTVSTAGRILKRNGLIQPPKRRRKTPPYTKPFAKVEAPNQLWCIDFKGHFKTQDGKTVYPLTITDAFSRYLLCCKALPSPDLLGVGKIMEKVFRKFGLPEAIRSDNGTPFASTGVGGLTKLSVWWTKFGIRHERIEPGNPQQNGRHERMHRTLNQEVCQKPANNLTSQNRKFSRFIREFNEERPHQALGNQTPSDIYYPSLKSYSLHNIDHDFPKFGINHVFVNRKGKADFKGKTIAIGSALADEFVDVFPNGKKRWAFAFGPILLGVFDERLNKFIYKKTREKL